MAPHGGRRAAGRIACRQGRRRSACIQAAVPASTRPIGRRSVRTRTALGKRNRRCQCLGVVRRIRRDGPGDAEVDQMRSVVGDNHVGWGDVPMDDAMPVQLGHGIAQLADQLCRRALRKFSLLLTTCSQRPPRYVVIRPPRNDRATRMLLDVWQAWVRAGAESRPYVALGQLGWDLLAHERTDASMLTSSVRRLTASSVRSTR